LDVGSRCFARDPLADSVGKSGTPVEAHCQLEPDPGPAVLHALEIAEIELDGIGLHEAGLDADAGSLQRLRAFPTDARIGITHREDSASAARLEQRVDARWCPAEVTARLESHVDSCALGVFLHAAESSHFGM